MIIKSNFIDVNIYKHHLESNTDLKDKPISIFNDYIPTTEELNINPYNFLIINEPNELFGLHDWAIYNSKSFSGILTWSEKILTQCENSILMPFGMSFLHENNRYEVLSQLPKQFEISYICGAKQSTQGHILRHKIFNLKNQINIPSKWFYTTEEPKEICFRNSMFHIAVENVKDNNWFTEKLIDAFLSKTIPIYWGCPNIGEFFDKNGIYTFSSEEDLLYLINSLTEEDYISKKESIENNYQLALYWHNYYLRLIEILTEITQTNNI
jgi:hypothetical protein